MAAAAPRWFNIRSISGMMALGRLFPRDAQCHLTYSRLLCRWPARALYRRLCALMFVAARDRRFLLPSRHLAVTANTSLHRATSPPRRFLTALRITISSPRCRDVVRKDWTDARQWRAARHGWCRVDGRSLYAERCASISVLFSPQCLAPSERTARDESDITRRALRTARARAA